MNKYTFVSYPRIQGAILVYLSLIHMSNTIMTPTNTDVDLFISLVMEATITILIHSTNVMYNAEGSGNYLTFVYNGLGVESNRIE